MITKTKRPTELQRLKAKAERLCEANGHSLHEWTKATTYSRVHDSYCVKCFDQVEIRTGVHPNDPSIFGAAIALECPVKVQP